MTAIRLLVVIITTLVISGCSISENNVDNIQHETIQKEETIKISKTEDLIDTVGASKAVNNSSVAFDSFYSSDNPYTNVSVQTMTEYADENYESKQDEAAASIEEDNGNKTSDNVQKNEFAVSAEEDLKKIVEINQMVHNSLRYGAGLSGASAKEVLKYGEGNCGDFTYLMLRELQIKGIVSRVVGVRSSYNNAIHSRIEVKVGGKWYTFDPTYGVYYPYSVQEMIENPDLAEEMQGFTEEYSIYMDKEFFKNAVYLEYHYTADRRDKNIVTLKNEVKISSDAIFSPNNGLEMALDNNYNTFAASNVFNQPQSFTLEFGSLQEIYRVKIKWLSFEEAGSSFLLEYFDDSTNSYKKILEENNYVDPSGDNVYEYILKENVVTKKVKFTINDTHGQKRILIREFMLFE